MYEVCYSIKNSSMRGLLDVIQLFFAFYYFLAFIYF